jgi:hypothetical protein
MPPPRERARWPSAPPGGSALGQGAERRGLGRPLRLGRGRVSRGALEQRPREGRLGSLLSVVMPVQGAVGFRVGAGEVRKALLACMIRDASPFVQVGLPGRIGSNERPCMPPSGRALPSAPASGHTLPTALVASPAHRGSLAGAARSMWNAVWARVSACARGAPHRYIGG